jgi:putative transposase
MSQREQFLSEWNWKLVSRTALCAAFGISRQTGYKWARRYERDRTTEEESRRPRSHPRTTPSKLAKLIVSQKNQFPLWGPVPIRARLVKHWPHIVWPSASTIGSILKKHGLVKPRLKRRRVAARTRPFHACREANDVWCVDFKGQFETRDGRLCYPLTVMDAASRYLLACTAFVEPTTENVKKVFVKLFAKYGLPKAIRSDNGQPFASVAAAAGLTKLSAWWARLGIQLERIDPGKPQQNGRHERMHLTLKQATCSPPKATLGWQQRAFDRFRTHYNEVRPHQALNLETPSSLYRRSPRPYPTTLPRLQYPFADVHVVAPDGCIKLNMRRQFISQSLVGEPVGLFVIDERYIEVVYADVVLGLIDMRNGNGNSKSNLIRPKPDLRTLRSTKSNPRARHSTKSRRRR